MDTARVARILDEMGTMLELRGENPFRVRAYHNAAQALKLIPGDLADRVTDGSLKQVPGIGETMLDKITRMVTTGKLEEYDALRRETPPGLVAMLRVPGLGPKKIKTLHDMLKIESLNDLKTAAEGGAIASLKGFGARTQDNILKGLAFLETAGDRVLQSTAMELALPIVEAIRTHQGVQRAEICGSLRRRKETIGDIDIVFSSDAPAPILAAFVARPEVTAVLGQGATKASVRLLDGVQCDLRGVRDDQFAFALHYFTGSKDHNIAMRRRAIARGLKLSEYGLEGDSRAIACTSEEELFKALDLHFIPPEMREDRGEIDLAEAGSIPPLVELGDLTGTFHCHTDWSDGTATLERMVEAARERGLTYLGIADHSRSAGYAGGLSIERVRQQWERIDALNATLGKTFRVFKGIECDILTDGSLDYPDEVLAGFDYVVASVHSNFGLPRDAMTARIVKAVSHPLVTMLGHATGRLLLTRDGYALDLDAVIQAAARARTMIEINANPHRLDIDDIHARRARDLGVPIVINPDAHSTNGLDDLDYGVGQARRAWLTPADVVNTRPVEEVAEQLARTRSAQG